MAVSKHIFIYSLLKVTRIEIKTLCVKNLIPFSTGGHITKFSLISIVITQNKKVCLNNAPVY